MGMGVDPSDGLPDLSELDLTPDWHDEDPAALDDLLREDAFEEPEDLGYLDDFGLPG